MNDLIHAGIGLAIILAVTVLMWWLLRWVSLENYNNGIIKK